MDYLQLATALAIFIAVALAIEGMYLLWDAKFGEQARRLRRRLGETAQAAGRESAAGQWLQERGKPFPESRPASAMTNRLARLLAQAGSPPDVGRFCLVSAGASCVVLAALLLAGLNLVAATAGGLGAGLLPLLVTLRRRARRQAMLERQLPEVLDLMSRTLRAGHSLPSAIKMAADEIADPIGAEFRTLFNEVNYGVPMQDALNNLSHRMPGGDTAFFVVATLIQRETGGNLAELLDSSARIIRERLKLLGQVEVYSAEGRLSAWILSLLPFGLGTVLYLVNPNFMSVLWDDDSGRDMLYGVAGLMAVGVVWMRSIIRIRV